jgi:hypothetical protein
MARLKYFKASDLGVSPGADIHGIDFGGPRNGWTGGNDVRITHEDYDGYDGVRLDLTGHLVDNSHKGVPIYVFAGAGVIELIGARVSISQWDSIDMEHEGGHKGIGVGSEKRFRLDGDVFSMLGGRVEGVRGTFGVHIRNYNAIFQQVDFEFGLDPDYLFEDENLGQHNVYAAGGSLGLHYCNFLDGSDDAEACKWLGNGRPWESFRYDPDCKLTVRNTLMQGTGSGLIIQGGAGDIDLEQLVIKDLAGRHPTAIGIDNGQSQAERATQERYWDENGVPNGPGASNRRLKARFLAIETKGKCIGLRNEVTHAQHVGDWPWIDAGNVPVVTQLDIKDCGFYGEGSHTKLVEELCSGDFEFDKNSCNTPQLDKYCRRNFGMETQYHADFR